jgi:hypothetical protein
MRLFSRVGAFEIAGDEVRLAVVQTGGAQPTLLEYHSAALSYGTQEERVEAFVAAVKRILGQVKARPSLYVLCMSSQSMVVRTLTVPFRGHARVSAAVPVELEPNLAFPIDDLIIDHSIIKEASGETVVLVVAAKQSILEEQVGEFAAAGVNIEGINLDVAGLATLWLAGQRKPAGLHAQLHVRDDSSLLTILYNKKLVYFRHIAVPATRVYTDPRALSRDTRNTLRAFGTSWQSGETIADLTVTGVDLDEAAREQFEDGLNVPVLYAALGKNARGVNKALMRFRGDVEGGPDAVRHIAHNRWEAAAGVAVAAAGGGVSFELRKGPLAPANPLTGLRPRLLGTAATLLVTLAGVAGYCTAQYQNNGAEIERVGAGIWTIYTETFPDATDAKKPRPEGDTGGVSSMALLEAAQKEADEASTRLSAKALARPPLLDIIKELADKLPDDKVVVTNILIKEGRGGTQMLTVSGEIMDTAGFNEALEKLKLSTVLHVDDDPTLFTREGKTSFTLQATI